MESDIEGASEAGDKYFIRGGVTYSPSNGWDSSLKDGTAVLPIEIIGVKAATTAEPPTSADWADTDAERPTISFAANQFLCGDYYKFRNCFFTGSADSGVLRMSSVDVIINCKVTNTSGIANREALYALTGVKAWRCEFSSTAGNACSNTGPFYLVGCTISAGDTGILASGNANFIANCIIKNCTNYGISFASDNNAIVNNTFYTCPTGILFGNAEYGQLVLNNIIYGSATVGINQSTAAIKNNEYDYNFYYGNLATTALLTEGLHSDETQTKNPGFVDAANGNFAIGSALKGDGYPGLFPGGLTTGYMSPGAVQPNPTVKKVIIF
jgi:hypothetical protein